MATMTSRSVIILLSFGCLLWSELGHGARPVNTDGYMAAFTGSTAISSSKNVEVARKKKKAFVTPSSCKNLFIQERASKQLPGPGQHFRFGALQEWEQIHQVLPEESKLVLLVRHGQAISNWLSDYLGPDVWFDVEEKCNYKDNGTDWEVFDAELTDLGMDQAKALNSMLDGGGWFSKLTAGKTARVIVSPLSRCLHTSDLVLTSLKHNIVKFNVEEDIRETLGEDTCDARRSASNPPSDRRKGKGGDDVPKGPCDFDKGLRSKFPQYEFPIRTEECDAANAVCYNSGFGLNSDEDTLWTVKRESQRKQVKRATRFLTTLFEHAPEQVIFVVTHSGFTRSVLLAVGREPYRPQNTELVPVIISKTEPPVSPSARSANEDADEDFFGIPKNARGWSDDDDEEDDEDDE